MGDIVVAMSQYFLNIPIIYLVGKLYLYCSAYSEKTQHILIQESFGILDM